MKRHDEFVSGVLMVVAHCRTHMIILINLWKEEKKKENTDREIQKLLAI
jgi:hypothetical protein